MANEIVPYQMSKALDRIQRFRVLIEWQCTRDDIRTIHEPESQYFAMISLSRRD
jgi:hypothetical protein